MTNRAHIRILIDDFELSKEGFKKGSSVKAEIDKQGKAHFGRCIVYSGDYKVL